MYVELVIFLAALAWSFLGCIQAINVVHGYRWRALLTSVAIGVAHLTIYRTVPTAEGWLAVTAFVTAGCLGSQMSMLVTKKLKATV